MGMPFERVEFPAERRHIHLTIPLREGQHKQEPVWRSHPLVRYRGVSWQQVAECVLLHYR